MMRLTWWLGFLLAALLVGDLGRSTAQADVKPVKPVKEWKGKFPAKEDEPLRMEAPTSGYIANEKAWAKLWKAWRGKEELPKVDFDRQLVLVGSEQCAANSIEARLGLDEKGDLKGYFRTTLLGGPGFVYLIVVVDRAGIKTYNGKAIEKE
jgi:hypothetical protein